MIAHGTRLRQICEKGMGTAEIAETQVLQQMAWVILALLLLDFTPLSENASQILSHQRDGWDFVCWPHFQNCHRLFLLDIPPWGFSYNLWMAFLFLAGLFAAVSIYRRHWLAAQLALSILILWKLSYHFALQQTEMANFQYYSLPLMMIWAWLPNKNFFLRVTFAVSYFFAAGVKFNASWIEGSYFSSLSLGLPGIPSSLIPWACHAVIVFEIFGSLFLLTRNPTWRRRTVFMWILFHLYSLLLVGYFYPLHCIPFLFLLFFIEPPSVTTPSIRQGRLGYLLLAGLIALNLIPKFVSRDPLYTGETYQYGLGMIDANYQCHIQWQVIDSKGKILEDNVWNSRNATWRCPPYRTWYRLHRRCEKDPRVGQIRYTHDLSVNGGPFYRVVDTENACQLNYSFWSENPWILTPDDGAKIVGYPRPNVMRTSQDFSNPIYPEPASASQAQTQTPSSLSLRTKVISRIYFFIWGVYGLAWAMVLSRRRLSRSR